ncbi:hypothetical protein CANINC_002078 [Pichia inconspicua]|uniref:Nitrogen regulatory protein areA GATA-like domain-containing protein n=1 Tax=Pichia inconspicua TaxID=52247 RepID=A0A4V4NFT0_9ASCO|nr:hypothetical protein CANINC_002078 [[Candida] inconspicua]
MSPTYLDSRCRPKPFLEISASTKEYIGFQLKGQAINENVNKVKFDNIVTIWTTLTKASDFIENGKRLENISWRLVNRKLLLKNDLSYKDVSTVIEVAKGLECEELKSNSQKRRLKKRIYKSNNKETATPKEKISSDIAPSLFSKKNLISNNDDVSPKKYQNKFNTNKTKDTNGRKINFFFNVSSPDSSSMSPPIRTQSSENIEKAFNRSNQSFNMLTCSSESVTGPGAPLANKPITGKLKETLNTTKNNSTTKSHAHQILSSHNHTHQHGLTNTGGNNHHHYHHQNNIYSTRPHNIVPSAGQNQQSVLSGLNPQKRVNSEKTGPPSLFKSTSQAHKTQAYNTILLNGRSSSQPSLVKLNQSQTKPTMNRNASQHNLNHNSKSSLFSFKPKAAQHVSISPDTKVSKKNKECNVEEEEEEGGAGDDNDNDDDDDDNDDSESDDESSGWSSLSDEDDDYDDDELHFEKQNIVASEVNARPVLKRSLLSGLFLDEMDKSDGSKEKDTATASHHEHYDLHHKSNAPLTAQTLLPTALTTHIFLPTRNFTTFQNAQRHQYSGQKTNGVPGSRSPIAPSQSQENMLQLTKDNVAKIAKDDKLIKSGYAASIHTTTSSIDIPGWELKKMREMRRDERKLEKETEGDELPVHLIDSLQNENKFFLDENIDTGFVDDKIPKKNVFSHLESDDDFNYHAKGW